MYLAPLNSDAGFKKVFADPEIAKAFLEALLGVIIEEITLIETDHKVTNAASLVKFDFRCKINGQYVIIEMQQAHKTDVIKRFYIYHCLNTCLQLEKIKDMIVKDAKGDEHRIRNYNELDPVITIIWMVMDTFGFKEDFMEYNTWPKPVIDFIKDDALWGQKKETILAVRETLVKMLDKKQRGVDFMQQNRIIYLFQPNIVENHLNKPYSIWFEFAEKTRQKENQVADFQPYLDNSIFLQIMERLATVQIEPEDLLKEMGAEAYYAAVKLGEEVMARHHRDTLYWQIYEEMGATFAPQIDAGRAALVKAYEKTAEANEKAETFHQKTLKAEQMLAKVQKTAEDAKASLKVEREKAKAAQRKLKQEKEQSVKAEQQKAKQALKAEQQKAKAEKEQLQQQAKQEKEQLQQQAKQEKEQLQRKAKQEKEQLLKAQQVKMVQKLLSKGTSIEIIADVLEVSVQQIQEWMKTFH
jgi:hypothetical protein